MWGHSTNREGPRTSTMCFGATRAVIFNRVHGESLRATLTVFRMTAEKTLRGTYKTWVWCMRFQLSK